MPVTLADTVRRLTGGADESLDEIFGLSAMALPHAGLALVVVDADGDQRILTHGVADVESRRPIDADTIFNIGSCSKAFAATLLQVLSVDDGLDLKSPIRRYAPDFAVLDPWISERATVHDALIHRVGVAPMFYLRMVGSNYADFVARFRFAPETTGFRNRFQYNNGLYIALGHLTERVTGCGWGQALRERLLDPLGMLRTSPDAPEGADNLALPHMFDGPGTELRSISLEFQNAMRGVSGPAGGVFASANDLAVWLRFQLRTNLGLDTPGLGPAERLRSMHEEKILIEPAATSQAERAQLRSGIGRAYAYGWYCGRYRNVRVLYHGGSTPGYRAAVMLVPEENVAIGILTNAFSLQPAALVLELLERAFGSGSGFWAGEFGNPPMPAARPTRSSPRETAPCQSDCAGIFHSPIYGALAIATAGDSHLSAQLGCLRMRLEPIGEGVFDARVENDWRGLFDYLPPMLARFERRRTGAVAAVRLINRDGITDGWEEELEFARA